jgi:hypothetical protein
VNRTRTDGEVVLHDLSERTFGMRVEPGAGAGAERDRDG